MDSETLFLALFMSVVGSAYCVYGKKRPAPVFLVCGLILLFAGYFITSFWITLAIAALLCIAPFFIR